MDRRRLKHGLDGCETDEFGDYAYGSDGFKFDACEKF